MILYVVGFGSGSSDGMTAAAAAALVRSDVIVGYNTYIDIIMDIFPAAEDVLSKKKIISTGMRAEAERVGTALSEARENTVSLVCSGDPELYGMAALAIELSVNHPDVDIEVIPGVSAAFSGGAMLGAPLTNDFAAISLSDLLTPWEKIEKRLKCAAEGDFVIVLYNPASKKRRTHLKNACELIMGYRAAGTVCGYARNIGREQPECGVLTLGELCHFEADMFTTVFIGNSETRIINGKMVTPRGYDICSAR